MRKTEVLFLVNTKHFILTPRDYIWESPRDIFGPVRTIIFNRQFHYQRVGLTENWYRY